MSTRDRFVLNMMLPVVLLGGIEPFMHSLFSFFHRRTDLYVIKQPGDGRMGFPQGVAENIVLNSFRKFPYKSPPKLQEVAKASSSSSSSSSKKAANKTDAPKKTKAAASSSSPSAGETTLETPPVASIMPPPAPPLPSTKKDHPDNSTPKENNEASSTRGGGDGGGGGGGGGAIPGVRYTNDGKQIPIGNGGIGKNYWWTQTLEEVTVYVEVPKGTKGKDVHVKMSSCTLEVGLKANDFMISGDLGGKIKLDESMWNLESNEVIVISMLKSIQTWWTCVTKVGGWMPYLLFWTLFLFFNPKM
jgi:hypothetical protein